MRYALFITIAWLVLWPSVVQSAEFPTNNDPNNQIRFVTAEEADARRDKLIRFIWPEGLPKQCLPKVTKDVGTDAFAKHLELLDQSLIGQVDRLETEVFGIVSLAYLIGPVEMSNPSRLAIIHAGHSRRGKYLNASYTEPIHRLLKKGYCVVMMHMPMRGWHGDAIARLPNGKVINPVKEGHAGLVQLPQSDRDLAPGGGFRPFLEPVIACINYWAHTVSGKPDVTMIGLSGGGWTTHMAAALDIRIRLSIPVAGSYPLYLRNGDVRRGSVGDPEQFFIPLYDENIAADGTGGGVATWLEIYTLGGFGAGRQQIMVTAQYDSCCFDGDPETTVNTFKDVVGKSVKMLGHGQWTHMLDTTHRSHQISPWVVEKVIEPNLCQK